MHLSLPDLELDADDRPGRVLRRAGRPRHPAAAAGGAPSPTEPGDLLDLGCGYGPIAVTLARRAPSATGVGGRRQRAGRRRCAPRTPRRTGRPACAPGSSTPTAPRSPATPGRDAHRGCGSGGIWSNPPIRIGKPALHGLLTTWLDRLVPDGRAWLVVQRHLGADSLARWLTEGEGWATSAASRLPAAGYRRRWRWRPGEPHRWAGPS